MRRLPLFALAALVACGGSGGDPAPPVTNPPPPPETSLWPLSAGSAWSWRVTDPVRGTFEKYAEVVGSEPVPDAAGTGIRVRDVEPTQEEWAWLVDSDGIVSRIREEDRRSNVVVRTTTFAAPGMPKNLSRAFPVGWSQRFSVAEVERRPDGTTKAVQKTYEWKVLAERQAVTVPAGTFECLVVQRQRIDTPDEPVRTYWLAPGVGKVKEDSRERTEELSGYDVKR